MRNTEENTMRMDLYSSELMATDRREECLRDAELAGLTRLACSRSSLAAVCAALKLVGGISGVLSRERVRTRKMRPTER